MIYHYLRNFCKFILNFCIKKIEVKGLENHPKNGPVLIAANHPNSFLDAIVISCKINRPVWSLARGDAFKKPLVRKFLSKLFMMPIYRISEGKEYVGKNDETFQKCSEIFKKDGQVLIFSEGLCINQTNLIPLKKGTGRLARQTWESGLAMQIMPVGISYDQYSVFGKSIILNYGEVYTEADIEKLENEGAYLKSFNEKLSEKLNKLLSRDFVKSKFADNPQYYLGWIVNFPIYFLLLFIIKSKTKKTVFFDSAMFGLLVFLLPIYWIFLGVIIAFIV